METSKSIAAAFIRFLAQEMQVMGPPINASVAPLSPRAGAVGAETIRATLLSVAAFLVRMSGTVPPHSAVFWTQVDGFMASLGGAPPAPLAQNQAFFENVLRVSNPRRLEKLDLSDLRLLPALADFDQRNGTAFADRARRLIKEFSHDFVGAGGGTVPYSEEALEEFYQVLEGKTAWALLGVQPANLAFLQDLRKTIDDAGAAVQSAMQGAWTQANPPQSGEMVLARALQVIAVHLAWSVGDVSDGQVRFFRDFAWFNEALEIRTASDRLASWRQWLEHVSREPAPSCRVPSFLSMAYLEPADLAAGTHHAERCRAMYLRFANAFAHADGEPSVAGDAAVANLRKWIYVPVPVAVVQAPPAVAPSAEAKPLAVEIRSSDELLAQLNAMVGLARVKTEVRQLVSFLKVQQLRASRGLPRTEVSRHLVFSGNPGTGKTTVARLLAAVYQSLGILSKGHLVETDRAGLVAGFLGQTALKVHDLVQGALGGVLFIDEAYALVERTDDSFGREAVDTLLKLMEDHRDNLIVVVAGYTDKMNGFLAANPGMKSRFNKYIAFDDYTADELARIFEELCVKGGFQLAPEAAERLRLTIDSLYARRDETFGNGRLARNLFETAINHQASRIVELEELDEQALSTVQAVDIPTPETLEPR